MPRGIGLTDFNRSQLNQIYIYLKSLYQTHFSQEYVQTLPENSLNNIRENCRGIRTVMSLDTSWREIKLAAGGVTQVQNQIQSQLPATIPPIHCSKTIVPKTEISNDPKLSILKAYRIASKRIGELNHAIANTDSRDDLILFKANRETLRAKKHSLAAMAREQCFKIWTNEQGKTCHTYEKDYKETPDENNDWNAYCVRNNLAQEEMVVPNVPTLRESIANEMTIEREEENEEPDYESGGE